MRSLLLLLLLLLLLRGMCHLAVLWLLSLPATVQLAQGPVVGKRQQEGLEPTSMRLQQGRGLQLTLESEPQF